MSLGRLALLLAVGLSVLLVVVAGFFPATADFRTQNPFWNGTTRFRAQHEVLPIASYAELPPDPRGTVLVVIPYARLRDLQRLTSFVYGGGTLILADDWGHGNAVLAALGIQGRFSGSLLLDPLINERDQWLPVAVRMELSPLTADVEALALNAATTLEGEGFSIVATSSPFAFLDLNRSEVREGNEPQGPFPVAGYANVGEGHVVILADPSVLINAMLGEADNARFLANALGLAGPEPRVLMDQGHLVPSRLDRTKDALAWLRNEASGPVAVATVIVVLVTILLAPLWRRKGATAWRG